jgi:serine O-acetyltransferase
VVLSPILFLLRPSCADIHHGADIGKGLLISHPALGIVISQHAVIGERAILTGGNCIGIRRVLRAGEAVVIGDDVNLGANAVVLGPVRIGNRARIGAGAVVVTDVPDDTAVAGVPASPSRSSFGASRSSGTEGG